MEDYESQSQPPGLLGMVDEAARALSALDGQGLEELAVRCRNSEGADPQRVWIPPPERSAVERELAVLRGILEATKANLYVLRNLPGGPASIEYAATVSKLPPL